ncbi:RNA polymerase sigma factor [Demequina sp. NBRC 110056]|uniref:RNA polymerase sigma factor n=1 Tax=Demequina sp. NBRC 110056 TaxID=1570345 RepID=UPI000A007050|nr:RNA polymerase sigma factor [Demequina sp. NBRC 110056]
MSDSAARLEVALRANSDDLLAFCERRLARDDASDALAEIMTVAWRRAQHLPAVPLEARMWLFGIARNVVANAHRSQVRRSRLADRLRALAVSAPANAPAADAGADVRDAISALPPDLAEVVRLRHWEGFSLAEIATIVDAPASTVRSRYAAAREKLAAALAEPREPVKS